MKPGQIDVWRIDLTLSDSQLGQYYGLLDEYEKNRAAAFVDDYDRRQWIAAHSQMRLILARYTGLSAVEIPIIQKRGEKPFIKDSQIFFNLSHTYDYALLAVSNTGELGIDIEYKRDNPKINLISRSTFSESEHKAIFSVEGEERKARFFRCWTRKEAFIKAIGQGFSYETKFFSVSVESDKDSRFIRFDRGDYDINQWNLLSFIPYANTQAALAFAFALTVSNFFEIDREPSTGEAGIRVNLQH